MGLWDIKRGLQIFNDRWAEILGYRLEEIRPDFSSWHELIHPDDADEVVALLTEHLEGHTPVYMTEYRLRHKSGKWVWILSVGVDITSQRQAEHFLLKSRKQMQSYLSAIDNIGLGLLVVDSNYCVRDMNTTMIDWFGDQRGTICYQSVAGSNKPCSYCRLSLVIENEETSRYQMHGSGGRILEIVAISIDNQDGRVSMMGIVRDITEQEHVLEKIQKMSSALESRVQERTLELEQKNEQLQQNKLEIGQKNITLRVLLDQQLATREELEEYMASRLQKLVYPYLDLLGNEVTSLQTKEYIEIIAAHLETMTSSFIKKLTNPLWQLTHREILVADLVHQGKCTREIGRLLNISPRTAERY